MKLKILFLFIIVLTGFNATVKSQISGTKTKISQPEIDSLIEKGKAYLNAQTYDLALQSFTQTLQFSIDSRYEKGIALANYNIGSVHRLKGNNPLALEFYLKAIGHFFKLSDSIGIADTRNCVGIIHTNMGDYSIALEYLFEALHIYKRHNDFLEESRVLINIGKLYIIINELDKAIEYMNESMLIKRKLKDQPGVANVLNNLGVIYRRKGEIDRALSLFEESFQIQRTLSDKAGMANSLNNIGIILHTKDQTSKAIEYFKEALQLREELGDNAGIAMGLFNLGFMYSLLEHHNKAFEHFQKSIEYAQIIKDNNLRIRAYEALSGQFQKTGDYKNALLYYEKFHKLNDSLFNEKSKNQLLEIQTKYETDQKEKELIKTRQVSLALGGLLLMAFFFVFAVMVSYRKNKRINYALKKQNKEIKRQKQKLEEAKELVQQNLRLKELFFAAANHDLRVPISIISGFTELLENKITDKDLLQYLESIKSSSKSLKKLVDDILELSTIESDFFKLNKEPVNLLHLANEIHAAYLPQITDKQIQFTLDRENIIDIWLLFDEVRIRQIIYNLLDNALKFTGKGEIKLKIEAYSKQEKDNYTLRITIEDTGVGIPEEHQKLIFDTSYSSKPASDVCRLSYGLGLQITRKLVDYMKGQIHLTSGADIGTKFEIEIPGLEAVEIPVIRGKKEIFQKIDNEVSNMEILIVDDSELNRKLLSILLRDYDITAREAENGQEALQIISVNKPELILMDIYMPVLDGYETLKKLKRNKNTRSIPVIAVTASASEEEKENVFAAGFDSYVTKPVCKEFLVKEINRLIKNNLPVSS